MNGGRESSAPLIDSRTQAEKTLPPRMSIVAATRGKRNWRIMQGLLKHYISQNISHIAHLFQGGWECSLLCVHHRHATEHGYSGDRHRQDWQQRCEGQAPALERGRTVCLLPDRSPSYLSELSQSSTN